MKDMMIILGIIIFWGILTITMTQIRSDPFLNPTDVIGNKTFSSDLPSGEFNMTDIDIQSPNVVTVWSYLDTIVRIFSFRISEDSDFPVIVSIFISFINYILVVIFALTIFRLVRHGGG